MLDLVAGGAIESHPTLILGPGAEFDRREVDQMVSRVARALDRPEKALVMCLGDRDLGTVLTYVATLRNGHAFAFMHSLQGFPGRTDADGLDLILRYRPEFVVVSDPTIGDAVLASLAATLTDLGFDYVPLSEPPIRIFRWRDRAGRGPIDGDTALLLGTSGSTGSARMGRISYEGVRSNSDAIIAALGIDGGERAITAVPIRHVFGLSVLNSHLRAGAGVVLSTHNPGSIDFWQQTIRTGATSLAAVPTTYRAMATRHLGLLRQSSVATMTMSGGALTPEATLRLAAVMAARGGRFVPMYGQTEAGGRISLLDPQHLPERIGSVGQVVPGGTLSITVASSDHPHRPGPAGEGEVCYDGPGVMQGYADDRTDLGRPADVVRPLRTGDLGYLDDGFLYLTGRLKRISKLFGQRINLDDVERMLDGRGVVVANDEKICIATTGPVEERESARKVVASTLGVPAGCVVVRRIDHVPLTHSGKTDYPAVTRAVAL